MTYDRDLAFIYRNPTRLVYGENTVNEVKQEVEGLGCSRAFIVTDPGIVAAGLAERVKKALGKYHVGTFDQCIQDSSLHLINEAAAFARSKGADVLISVGGGSVIDTAKGMAIVLKEGGGIEDHQGMQMLSQPQTPHIVIPTTAGTGSEVSYFAVIKDQDNHRKLEFSEDRIIPNVGILDPVMTVGLPSMLTATTGMDAFCHALESIHTTQCTPITDALASHAIEMIVKHLPICVENGKDLYARGQQLLASTLAGIAFNNAQVALVHAMAHTIGGLFSVPHGTANSILMPHVVRFNMDVCANRYRRVAGAMGLQTDGKSDEDVALDVADAITAFTKKLGIPQSLKEVDVPEDRLAEASEVTLTQGPMVFNPKFVSDPEVILGILKNAW